MASCQLYFRAAKNKVKNETISNECEFSGWDWNHLPYGVNARRQFKSLEIGILWLFNHVADNWSFKCFICKVFQLNVCRVSRLSIWAADWHRICLTKGLVAVKCLITELDKRLHPRFSYNELFKRNRFAKIIEVMNCVCFSIDLWCGHNRWHVAAIAIEPTTSLIDNAMMKNFKVKFERKKIKKKGKFPFNFLFFRYFLRCDTKAIFVNKINVCIQWTIDHVAGISINGIWFRITLTLKIRCTCGLSGGLGRRGWNEPTQIH